MFSEKAQNCYDAVMDKTWKALYATLFLWVCVQYLKLTILFVSLCCAGCCIRSGVKEVKSSEYFAKIAMPNHGKKNSGFAPSEIEARLLGGD